MPLTRLHCDHCDKPETFDHVLDAARRGETKLPFPFLKAIISQIQNRQAVAPDNQISVSDVVGCARQKYLRATEEYTEDPNNLVAAFRGTLMHKILSEFAQEEAIVETRTSRDYKGHTLYGTADSIITTRTDGKYKLIDFKSTKKIPQWSPWSNHISQTNLYRWVYDLPEGTPISVIYFDLNGGEIAERPVKAKDLWPDTKVEEYLDQRFVPIAEALQNKKIPLYRDVPPDILSWMCSWCPVFDSCLSKLMDEPGATPIFANAARNRK